MQLRLIKEPWISGGGNFETNNNIDFNTIPLPMKKMPPKNMHNEWTKQNCLISFMCYKVQV